jgi:hypothetical protein
MISEPVMRKLIARLSLLPFFPAQTEAKVEISEVVEEFAEADEQVDWLGRRMLALYKEWPGPRELRACFCSRYKPKDGFSICSAVYAKQGGIPSERPAEGLLLGPRLLPGQQRDKVTTQDPVYALAIAKAAEVMTMPPLSRRRQRFSKELAGFLEGATPRPASEPTPQLITQADIDRAVEELRERKAHRELEGGHD